MDDDRIQDIPLTMADQAFVNFAASLCFFNYDDRPTRLAAIDQLRTLLPRVNRDHRLLHAIADHIAELVAPDTPPARKSVITSLLHPLIYRFLMWRGAAAMERLHDLGAPKTGSPA